MNRFAAAASAVLIAVSLAGCGGVAGGVSSRNATQEFYTPENGRNGTAGDLQLRSVLVIRGDGLQATVLAGFRNPTAAPDQLVGVSVEGTPGQLDQPVTIPAGGYASIGLREGDPVVVVPTVETEAGYYVDVEFTFAVAPRTTITTIVQPATGVYAGYGPPASTPSPSPAAAATPTATPS